MNQEAYLIKKIPEFSPLFNGADHIDIKEIEGHIPLRNFIINMLAFKPWWVKSLFAVRWFFVKALGISQNSSFDKPPVRPEELSMTPGEKALFFTVTMARENIYWVAEATETHLSAYMGVFTEALPTKNKFYVFTIVKYHKWTGPVYFNTIRPFHHLVLRQMMEEAINH